MKRDSWLIVWLIEDQGSVVAVPDEEARVSAALEQFCDSGGRDRVVMLELLDGRTAFVRVSQVAGCCLSTPETRRAEAEIEAAARAEWREFRSAAGLPFEDER